MTTFVDDAIALIKQSKCYYSCSALRVAARKRNLTFEQAAEIVGRYYQASTCVVQPYWWNHPDLHIEERVANLELHRNELNTMFDRYDALNKAKLKEETDGLAKELAP